MRTLILVDLQNDFCPGGALSVAGGDQVVRVARRIAADFDLVVATQDWHPADHQSFAANHEGASVGDVIDLHGLSQVLWPVHCVQNTRGAELVRGLDDIDIHQVFRKGTDPMVDSYSGLFDNGRRRATGLGEYLRRRSVESVHVMGLALDYCVKYTALDLVREGFSTHLEISGCRAVNRAPGDGAAAIAEMREVGVEIDA